MLTEILPESIVEMAQVIGINKALSIVALRGGTRLAIPVRANRSHWLIEIIGFESFQKFCQYYSGSELIIPRCKGVIGLITNKEILEDRKNLTIAGLARKYDYTERGIAKALERIKNRQWIKIKP